MSTAIFIILIPLAFFMLLRANPQRRRVTAQQQMLKQLSPGDRVVTASGMIGTLLAIDGDRAAVEAAPGVVLEFLTPAIVRRVEDEPAAEVTTEENIPADFSDLDVPDDLSELDPREPHADTPEAHDVAPPTGEPHPTTDEGRDEALDTEPRAPGPEES